MKKIFYFVFCFSLVIVSLFSLNLQKVSAESGVWAEKISAGSRDWISITSSSDGTKLAAVAWGGYIYTSTDSGNTWVERISAGKRNWYSITSSSDGTKLAAVVNGGYIYTSTDSGNTWVQKTSDTTRYWYSITSSSDGTKLAAVVRAYSDGYIYTSTDSGNTWVQKTSDDAPRYWNYITSSSDGTKLAAVDNSYIYTSTDSGNTWVQKTSDAKYYFFSITSSSDGTKLAAVVNGGYIYTSTDSGNTWVERTSAGKRYWYLITSSSDGTKLAAVAWKGYIYTSTDSGNTWVQKTSDTKRNWLPITSSSDGIKLAAGEWGGYIYTYSDSSAPSTSTPSVTTSPASSVTKTSAVLNGNITSNGGSSISTSGFKYGTTSSYVNTTKDGPTSTGTYSKEIYGLVCDTTYHFRAYATNTKGTTSGSDQSFTTSSCGTTSENGVWIKSTFNFSGYPRSVSSSTDGLKILLVTSSWAVYNSTDGGITWIDRGVIDRYAHWSFSDSSADGKKLVIADAARLYTSNDGGITWTRRMADELHNWTAVAISADGSTIAAADYGRSYIAISHDSGVTWIKSEINDPDKERNSFDFYSVTSSADGTKLAAVDGRMDGYIYTSNDGGATWTKRTSAGAHYWVSIASSADGTKLAAGVAEFEDHAQDWDWVNAYIYTSNDSGATWTKRTSSGINQWWDIASSADGKKLAAVDLNKDGLIYLSNDSGATWVAQTSIDPIGYISIASSADGTKLVAASGGIDRAVYLYSSPDSSTNPPSTPTTPSSNITTPSVSTSISFATQNAANLNGNIISNGGSSITKSGFKYGLTTSYSNTTTDGPTITGAYRKDIYGLICGTTYHFQAYATNEKGTAYGSDKTFTTSACDVIFTETATLTLESPSVDTLSASSITDVSAVLNAEITDRGDSSITKSGFNYGLNTVSGKITKDGPTTSGKYSKKVEGLTCDTKYYFSAYATNSDGTGRGDFKTFTTDLCHKVEYDNTPVRIEDELPSASPSVLYRTLKITYPRTTGNDVATLQTYLNSRNYNCGIADGVFGTKTKAKVMEWQRANGLTPDGSFGPKSRVKAGL